MRNRGDSVLALIFLLVCAVVVWPLVSHWLKTAEIPDGPVFVDEDGTPYGNCEKSDGNLKVRLISTKSISIK